MPSICHQNAIKKKKKNAISLRRDVFQNITPLNDGTTKRCSFIDARIVFDRRIRFCSPTDLSMHSQSHIKTFYKGPGNLNVSRE